MNPNWTKEQVDLYNTLDSAIEDIVDFSAKKVPALGNKGTPEVVDMAGRQNELRKGAEKLEALLKNMVTARLEGKTEVRGDRYQLTVQATTTTRLNQGKAKELLELLCPQLALLKSLFADGLDCNAQEVQLVVEALVSKIPDDMNCMDSSEGGRRVFTKLAPPAQ